jgi:hypothetical protein
MRTLNSVVAIILLFVCDVYNDMMSLYAHYLIYFVSSVHAIGTPSRNQLNYYYTFCLIRSLRLARSMMKIKTQIKIARNKIKFTYMIKFLTNSSKLLCMTCMNHNYYFLKIQNKLFK